MLVEHTFVTTLECEPALSVAKELLGHCGFIIDRLEERALQARRGKNKPAAARRIDELPQRVRLEFDRGRVTLAASIQEHQKATQAHTDLLITLAAALEAALVHGTSIEETLDPWRQLESRIAEEAKRRRRRYRIGVAVLLSFIVITAGILLTLGL